jgi:intergrase/recombinase
MKNVNKVIGKTLNEVLKILYQYKRFNIEFNTSNEKSCYLHCSRNKCNAFYHFFYEFSYHEAIITKVIVSYWNVQKQQWNKEITIKK